MVRVACAVKLLYCLILVLISPVSSRFAKRVKPTWVATEAISYSAVGGNKSSKSMHNNVCDLNFLDVNGAVLSLIAVEVPTICAPLLRPSVPAHNVHAIESIQFADNYMQDRELTVDILVGLDAYWKFITPNKCLQTEGLVAQETVFGWVLSGACSSVAKGNVFFFLRCCGQFAEVLGFGIC